MRSGTSATAISLVVFFGFSPGLCAQRTKAPSLDEILQRLQANLNHYDADVPSLFCDEHVVSSEMEPGRPDQKTITDSVFRLKRTREPDDTTTLVESREIKSIDGKAAASQKMDGPSLLNGMFEGGLAVVSQSQTSCMNYTLERTKKNRPNDPYVVRFANVLTPQNSAGCFLQEKSKGRVFVDPASMQVTRVEITTPRHTIIRGNAFTSRIVGKRELTVDYAPVLLDRETFWMPSAINMTNTGGSGFHAIVWSFSATYRNYHRLEVKSRVLPGGIPIKN